MTITLSPGATPERVIPCRATASGSASAAWRADRPGGSRSERGVPHQQVAGEGTVVAVDDRALAVLALGGLPLEAAAAPPALGRGAADHRLADRPALHPLAQGGHGAGELVAGHQAGLVAPPVEQHVDVRAADPAVVDLDQHLARARAGAPGAPRPPPRPAAGRRRPASPRAAHPWTYLPLLDPGPVARRPGTDPTPGQTLGRAARPAAMTRARCGGR